MDKNEKLFEVCEAILEALRSIGKNSIADDGVAAWVWEDSAQILARATSEKILSKLEAVEDEDVVPHFEGDDWIGKYYEMNPVEEDLLPSGHFLAHGMKVVPESSQERVDIFGDVVLSARDIFQARKQNRWFTVSDIRLDENGKTIHFVATYEDGVKRKWTTSVNSAWIFKLDSVPDDPYREYLGRAEMNPDAEYIIFAKEDEDADNIVQDGQLYNNLKKEVVQASMWKQHLSED